MKFLSKVVARMKLNHCYGDRNPAIGVPRDGEMRAAMSFFC
jgi:hypothetical protein